MSQTPAFGNYDSYVQAVDAVNQDAQLTADQKKDLINLLSSRQYSPGQDLSQFETLLGKLEGSKMRQQKQRSELGRQDIFAQGIANMMTNF
jgi:hypothetical protein